MDSVTSTENDQADTNPAVWKDDVCKGALGRMGLIMLPSSPAYVISRFLKTINTIMCFISGNVLLLKRKSNNHTITNKIFFPPRGLNKKFA